LATPEAFSASPGQAAQLARQRGDLAKALAAAEDEWLQLSAEVELAAR
jgi:ATP-binding cassette subfamily F protein 3